MDNSSHSAAPERPRFPFTAVPLRPRHDGWTADRQIAFIEALAECGCVDAACRRVGMQPSSAYALKRRHDALSFRQAWDHALDYAIGRLSDAAYSRALNGVARPVFHKGEQVGERRYFDERLTQFLLRYRDPLRYGAWHDKMIFQQASDGPADRLAHSLTLVTLDATYAELGKRVPKRRPMPTVHHVSQAEQEERDDTEAQIRMDVADKADAAKRDAAFEAGLDEMFGEERETNCDVA